MLAFFSMGMAQKIRIGNIRWSITNIIIMWWWRKIVLPRYNRSITIVPPVCHPFSIILCYLIWLTTHVSLFLAHSVLSSLFSFLLGPFMIYIQKNNRVKEEVSEKLLSWKWKYYAYKWILWENHKTLRTARIQQLLIGFSAWSNALKLLDTRVAPPSAGQISCIHGIRWVQLAFR